MPNDSICGCSVDEVHREIWKRFAKVNQVGNFVKKVICYERKGKISIRMAQSDYLLTVILTGLHDIRSTVCAQFDVATCVIKELHPTEGAKKMAALISCQVTVEDTWGRPVEVLQ